MKDHVGNWAMFQELTSCPSTMAASNAADFHSLLEGRSGEQALAAAAGPQQWHRWLACRCLPGGCFDDSALATCSSAVRWGFLPPCGSRGVRQTALAFWAHLARVSWRACAWRARAALVAFPRCVPDAARARAPGARLRRAPRAAATLRSSEATAARTHGACVRAACVHVV